MYQILRENFCTSGVPEIEKKSKTQNVPELKKH